MVISREYAAAWQDWHDKRVQSLNHPYGVLSVVSQDWLTEGEFFTSPFVPGQWLLKDGEIHYHPDAETSARGQFLAVDGRPAVAPTHIPHGYNRNSGTGSGVSAFFNALEVETITRLNAAGETIHAVRVRDPAEAAHKRFDDIPCFPLSEEWIVPARFVPAEITLHSAPTVEEGIFEAGFVIGTIEVVIDGATFRLEAAGHRAGSHAEGYFINDYRVHFGDRTNGAESYGGGRVVQFESFEALQNLSHLDFNRAISLPCALSTFIACHATPPGNRLPFRVTAGEHTPPIPHERIATYRG